VRAVPLYGARARGRVAWVSERRYDLVMAHRWNVQEFRRPGGGISGPYASTNIRLADGRRVKILMHVLIMGRVGIDHRNGYGLDNTDPNLREATGGQNQQNQGLRAKVSSRYKGVYWHKQRQTWRAEISADGTRHRLGSFAVEEDAGRAYDEAARELHGEFARLNFPNAA
jgi:AP2 domain-containing protein